MESIRNFLKSRLGIILLVLCLSPLAILGLESYFRGGTNTNEVVKVGEQSISRIEYQNALNAQRNEILSNGIEDSAINNKALNNQVLKDLINRALLKNQTQDLGMYVSDSVINGMLIEDPRFADDQGQFSNDIFAMSLQRQGITKQQMFDQYREQLNIVQLYNAITNTALYTDKDINQLIALQQETRNAWLHRVPWQDFRNKVSITDAEIQTYYDTHQQDLNSLAMVDLTYLVLDPSTLQIDPVTEEDIEAQYASFKSGYSGNFNQQVSQILVTGDAAADTMQTIQQRLDEGDTFESLVKEFSEDPVSRDKGGDIGAFNADVFGADAPAVEAALQGLDVGDITEPVQTSFGYQIFKVTAMEGDEVPTLESMREQLTESVKQQKRDILFSDQVTRINEMATDGLGIEDIAQEEGLSLKTIKDYTKVDNTSLLNQPAVIEAAFDDFNIQDEAVSTNIEVDDVTVWVQPTNYRPIHPLSLEEASESIKQTLVKEKAIELAVHDAKRLATEVNNKGLDDVDADFVSLGEISRQHPMLSAEEKAIAFSQDNQSSDLTAVSQQTEQGASVMVMGAIKQVDTEDVPEFEVNQAASMLRQNRGQEHFADYLYYLEMITNVEKNETAIKEVSGI